MFVVADFFFVVGGDSGGDDYSGGACRCSCLLSLLLLVFVGVRVCWCSCLMVMVLVFVVVYWWMWLHSVIVVGGGDCLPCIAFVDSVFAVFEGKLYLGLHLCLFYFWVDCVFPVCCDCFTWL